MRLAPIDKKPGKEGKVATGYGRPGRKPQHRKPDLKPNQRGDSNPGPDKPRNCKSVDMASKSTPADRLNLVGRVGITPESELAAGAKAMNLNTRDNLGEHGPGNRGGRP